MTEIPVLALLYICYFIIFLIAYVRFRRIINPVSVIAVWFLFWCIVSCTKILGFRVDFNFGRTYVLSNILIMMLAMVLAMGKGTSVVESLGQSNNTVGFLKTRIHNCLTVICLIVEVALAISVVLGLLSGRVTFLTWRTQAYSDTNGLFSAAVGNIYFVFIKGYVIFDIIMEIASIMYNTRKIRILPFINIVLFCAITINRIEIVRTVFVFFIAWILQQNRRLFKVQNKKAKRLIKWLAIAVSIVVLLRFFIAGSDNSLLVTVLRTVFRDFSIPYVTFDRAFSEYQAGMRVVDCTIFDILFGGIFQIFDIFTRIFGYEIVNYNGILAMRLNYGIDIGANMVIKTNAFYTMYYNLMHGGGLIAPYFVSAGFGVIIARLYRRWKRLNTVGSFALLVFFMHIVIMGLLRWEFYAHWSWVTLFCVVFLGNMSNIRLKANRKERF